MKRVLGFVSTLFGVLALGVLVTVLVLVFGGLHSGSPLASSSFRSPIESFGSPVETPRPNQVTPQAQPTVLPLMASKAAAVALSRQQQSPLQPTLRPIHSAQDVIETVLTDRGFQANLDDPIFGARSKGATPGEPIFVKSLDSNKWDYYLVPFYKGSQLSGVAVVGVKDGSGMMGMWANASGDRFPPVSAIEAQKLVESKGFAVLGQPRLVFRWLREGGDETCPFWEVKTASGLEFYVIHILNATKVYRGDEVHPLK